MGGRPALHLGAAPWPTALGSGLSSSRLTSWHCRPSPARSTSTPAQLEVPGTAEGEGPFGECVWSWALNVRQPAAGQVCSSASLHAVLRTRGACGGGRGDGCRVRISSSARAALAPEAKEGYGPPPQKLSGPQATQHPGASPSPGELPADPCRAAFRQRAQVLSVLAPAPQSWGSCGNQAGTGLLQWGLRPAEQPRPDPTPEPLQTPADRSGVAERPTRGHWQLRNCHPAGNARGREGTSSLLGGPLAPGSPVWPWELEAELPRLRGRPELPAPLSRLGLRVVLQPFLARALGQLLLYLRAGLS